MLLIGGILGLAGNFQKIGLAVYSLYPKYTSIPVKIFADNLFQLTVGDLMCEESFDQYKIYLLDARYVRRYLLVKSC